MEGYESNRMIQRDLRNENIEIITISGTVGTNALFVLGHDSNEVNI